MGKQARNNRKANADAGPKPYKPGPLAWKCVPCSRIPAFRDGPLGAYWVGQSHAICNRAECSYAPKKGAKSYDGTLHPGPAAAPSSSPSQRTPAVAAKQREADLQKKLDAADKENKRLRDAAKQPGGATAAPAAPAAVDSTVASGSCQASTPPDGAAI